MHLAPELNSKIDPLWDKFWSGGLSNPLQSIEQMSYLIFMNRLEVIDNFEETRAKAKGLPYPSLPDLPPPKITIRLHSGPGSPRPTGLFRPFFGEFSGKPPIRLRSPNGLFSIGKNRPV